MIFLFYRKADIALIGLAVMGQNLILNMDSKGFVVCAYNRTVDKVMFADLKYIHMYIFITKRNLMISGWTIPAKWGQRHKGHWSYIVGWHGQQVENSTQSHDVGERWVVFRSRMKLGVIAMSLLLNFDLVF